ncbi:histidinol dehydrogenase, partial [uncultured Corynebacterium sp.]|uniref:histidinol dehydrogenase n=1 Tax=uncultured Corynebacterium sp. TaxID=159447 RepID=UPI00262B7916
VAYDLISQAEHDVLASSVLITDSAELAEAVDAKISELYTVTLNSDRVAQALTGDQSAIVVTSGLEQSIAVANAYAAEHLEVHTRDAAAVASRIVNAGAIFVGPHAPVPLGDYAAGSNHVLPTSGSARYSSGLSTLTFLKHVDIIDYDGPALEEIADDVIRLSQEERLPAHGEAIAARRNK